MLRKKMIVTLGLMLTASATDLIVCDNNLLIRNSAVLAQAPNDGSYTRTSSSVKVYTESGHKKGTFPIYLHKGKRYIDFDDKWIYIQGKRRFFYRGNWYIIK
mgnify:CR=1 FL=1